MDDHSKFRSDIIIGITTGDVNGIGPEVLLKALTKFNLANKTKFVIFGSDSVFKFLNIKMNLSLPIQVIKNIDEIRERKGSLFLIDIFNNEKFNIEFGTLSGEAGLLAALSLENAIKLALDNKIDAVVTLPVSKYALNLAGREYPGQTEMFAHLTGTKNFLMVLMVENFRVGLVTTHCAISDVSGFITKENVLNKIRVLDTSLRKQFRDANHQIAVTSLNPHGGEEGLFGREEIEHITPAIDQALAEGINVNGPFPADTLFAQIDENKFSAYLTMYHDQGLIPLKIKSFGRGVNFTAGLPIIRTSPDHGTAFDIAGKGIANDGSMREALKIGIELAEKRRIG